MGATPYIPSLAVDTVCEAIAAFIQPFVGVGTPIIRAYDNRTSPPPDPYVELIELLQVDIETPSDSYDGTNQQIAIAGPKRIDVQINIVGVAAADQCAAIKTVMRTAYAASQFPVGVAPLYCDDGRCNPMITGEQQYDYRWTLTISCQYNPIVTLPQQSANALAISISEALE
jgi:hypothetical protein